MVNVTKLLDLIIDDCLKVALNGGVIVAPLSREIYKINKTELKQLPCRTPQLKLKSSEDQLLI